MSAHFCSWTCLRIAAALTDAVLRQQRDTAGRKDRCATCLVAWIGCRLLGSLGSLVERARILLAYRAEPFSTAVGAQLGVTHQTVQGCLHRAVRLGVMAALDDSPRPRRAREITPEARAWLAARVVDHAAAGPARPRACGCGRASLSEAHRARHGLQNPRRA